MWHSSELVWLMYAIRSRHHWMSYGILLCEWCCVCWGYKISDALTDHVVTWSLTRVSFLLRMACSTSHSSAVSIWFKYCNTTWIKVDSSEWYPVRWDMIKDQVICKMMWSQPLYSCIMINENSVNKNISRKVPILILTHIIQNSSVNKTLS